MLHVVEAGTDAATVWLFDPAALPGDFETRFQEDSSGIVQRLGEEGRLVSINTGADGACLLHAFDGESIPSSLQTHITDPLVTPDFKVPSGRIFFTGGEYGSPNVEQSVASRSHMGGSFPLTPGTYELTIWRTEFPGDQQERDFASEVSSAEYRVHQSLGWFILSAVVGGLMVLTLSLAFAWSRLHEIVLVVEVVLIASPFLVTRLPIYRRADARWQAIGRRYPSIVAHLAIKRMAEGG